MEAPSRIRYYAEGNDQYREIAKGEVDPEFEENKDSLPPDERIITEFMLRVGGVLMPTEDRKLIDSQLATTRELDEVVHKADKEDQGFEEKNVSREVMVKSAISLLKDVFDIRRRMDGISAKRDERIAEAITSSLKDTEVGFLFLGGNHNVESYLPQDIQVELLDERLPGIIREVTRTDYHEEEEDEPLEPINSGGEIKG
jgi:hypothetical protein